MKTYSVTEMHTCNEHLWVVCFREGHRVEAGIRRHLARGEADVSHRHCEGLAAAPRGAEQGLLGHFAEASDDRHAGTCEGEICIRKKPAPGSFCNRKIHLIFGLQRKGISL